MRSQRKTLEDFDFSYQRSTRKKLVAHLGRFAFVVAKDNIIFLGPPGTEKSHCETREAGNPQWNRGSVPVWCWRGPDSETHWHLWIPLLWICLFALAGFSSLQT